VVGLNVFAKFSGVNPTSRFFSEFEGLLPNLLELWKDGECEIPTLGYSSDIITPNEQLSTP